jgi:hypothetical protein
MMRNHLMFRKFFVPFVQTFVSFVVKKGIITYSILLELSIAISIPVKGQSEKLSENIIEIAEELAANEEDPEAVSMFIDRLHELAENPVKINSSNEKEISRLFFLSDFQVKALAEYTHSSGRIVSLFELAAIPGFDKETAEMISPFITLEYNTITDSDSARWKNSILSNFSIKSSGNDTSFLGSYWRILTKYKFTARGFSGGYTMEKDPGEKLLTGNPPRPDFFSAHLAYRGNGPIRKLIIGDYSARFGQGTNINTGMRRAISPTSLGYMSASDEIKPYTSTEENKFFRGLAAEFSLKNIELTMFFSKNYSDATIVSASDSSDEYIENLYCGGVHNTPSLVKKKDNIFMLAYGIALSYNFRNIRAGLIWSETRFSLPVNLHGNDPEKIYDFTGDRNDLYTLYYNSFIRKILLYGELSADKNGKYALVQGMSFRPSDRLTISFLFRDYKSGYITFYGQGPGTGSRTANEKGILGSFSFEAAKHLFISGGCDIQYFPWLKYRCSSPSRGVRREIKIRYLPSEKLILDASYNYRLSMTDNSDAQSVPDQNNIITRSLKSSVRYSFHDNLIVGTRIDYKVVNQFGSSGFSLFQEINYRFRNIPISLWARYCLFNTDDWYARIYTYENDLLYSCSIPALAGEGSRSYIMARWETGDFSELRIKYGITSLVKNGNSLKNTDELKLQFRIWF